MTIYNVIEMGDRGVISITSFPVIDEQLSWDALGQAEEHFKGILNRVAGDYFKKYNDIDDFVEDRNKWKTQMDNTRKD